MNVRLLLFIINPPNYLQNINENSDKLNNINYINKLSLKRMGSVYLIKL